MSRNKKVNWDTRIRPPYAVIDDVQRDNEYKTVYHPGPESAPKGSESWFNHYSSLTSDYTVLFGIAFIL